MAMAVPFSDAVAAARGEEVKEVAALVLKDRGLQAVIACWPNVPRKTPAETDAISLDALWAEVEFDERDVVDLSGLPSGVALSAFRRAKGNRLLLPDGSVHQVAKVVLQQLIKKAFG